MAVDKDIRDAIEKVYDLNDGLDDGSFIYAFPFDHDLVDAFLNHYKDSLTDAFVPKADNDTDACPYLIARAGVDGGGYAVFVFTAGFEVEKLLDAVKCVVEGGTPD